MSNEELVALANQRIQGPMKAKDLDDEHKEVSAGFRAGDKVYVAKLSWKKVKYAGKESYNFTLEVWSLDPQRKEKMMVPRLEDGKARDLSMPALNLEVSRSFKQEVKS